MCAKKSDGRLSEREAIASWHIPKCVGIRFFHDTTLQTAALWKFQSITRVRMPYKENNAPNERYNITMKTIN